MYSNFNGDGKGITPYTAPALVIYENKKFKYDEIGNIKAIVDIETTEQKQTKFFVKKLVKTFVVLFVIFIAIDIIRINVFTFSVKKWQKHPALRITMTENFNKICTPNAGEKAFIKSVCENRKSFSDDAHKSKLESMKKVNEDDSLLFLSDKEVALILGEPVLKNELYPDDELTEEQKVFNQLEYGKNPARYTAAFYDAYELKGEKYYVYAEYYDDIVIKAFITDRID